MKSFKNKISQKGKRIKANQPSTKDINKIVEQINTGKINIPRGADPIEVAKNIIKQNSKNAELLSQGGSGVISRGEYDTVERIESNLLGETANRVIGRKFGSEEDYVEAHIYNLKGQ